MKLLIPILVVLYSLVCSNEAVKIKQQINLVQRYKEQLNDKPKTVFYAYKKDNKIKLSQVGVKNLGIDPSDKWLAKGVFMGDNYNLTGWSLLEIETNDIFEDSEKALGVGMLEGAMTRDLISLHLLNTVGDFCDDASSTPCAKLIQFLTENFNWISEQIKQNPKCHYWYQVELVYYQFMGLYSGYYEEELDLNRHRNIFKTLTDDIKPYLKLLALQLNGDMSELFASFSKISDPFMAGSCSALIKLLPNNDDLFASHVTWTVYESMLRILKHYKFNYNISREIDSQVIPGSEVAFSSYPGILASIDDFYVLNTNLVVLETTIGNSNSDLWKFVTPETNLYWVRIMVANRLAHSGVEWAKLFSMHNSGTYNNEWMVIDYELFTPGEELKDNLFIVLEQIPGQIMWEDKTDVLRSKSYWSSYNLAYYPEIYNISGTYDAYLKYGSFFSYEDSPRASIFRRDHSKVQDLDSMIKLMRYNNYTKEPFAKCDCYPPYTGENTISARSDLNPASGKYPFDALGHRDHGATDMKLTSSLMAKNLEFIAISGPTFDDEDVPPFVWSQADFGNTTNHFGHPDKWSFDPIHVKWRL